jgi:transcriptional antiterminator RfaH
MAPESLRCSGTVWHGRCFGIITDKFFSPFEKDVMDLWRETNWYAVHAKPRRESFGAANVAALGVEILLPQLKQDRLVRGYPRTKIKPLFAGYFFARFCPAVYLDLIRYALGILHVVSTSQFPIPLGDDVIASIRKRVQPDGYVRLSPASVRPGDWVVIEHGPFEGLIGEVVQQEDDGKRVAILLEMMMSARVSVEKRWLSGTPAVV